MIPEIRALLASVFRLSMAALGLLLMLQSAAWIPWLIYVDSGSGILDDVQIQGWIGALVFGGSVACELHAWRNRR